MCSVTLMLFLSSINRPPALSSNVYVNVCPRSGSEVERLPTRVPRPLFSGTLFGESCEEKSGIHLLSWPKKMATWIMHKIRTLFLSRNITRLAQWCGWPRLHTSLHRSAIKLYFSITRDRNSVLILCIIQVAGFILFWPG